MIVLAEQEHVLAVAMIGKVRTRTGKLVHLDVPARIGSLVDVRIERAGPFSLRGQPVDSLVLV